MECNKIGIWTGAFRSVGDGEAREHAALLDELGFDALWIPGGGMDGILSVVAPALEATENLKVASGILSVWRYPAADVAATYFALQRAHKGRVILGLGVSHASTVNTQTAHTFARPLTFMRSYLDELDAAGLTESERILAALGPKMTDLGASRSAGVHPYCIPVEHTQRTRERIGEGPIIVSEVKVVLESDPIRAREIARTNLDRYLKLENYVNNLLRLGWDPKEIAGGGSDRLIDALVGWGSPEQIRDHIESHLRAGATQAAVHVLTPVPETFPDAQWRELADLVSDLL